MTGMNALGIPTSSSGKCSRDQRKPLMIHPCHLSPPHSLMVPQLPSYFLQKSQQQRRFQGSLISLACPNYSEAGHKDKIHQPAARELSLAEKMTDFMTHFPLITKSMYVCMHAKTHQPSKWDNSWKMNDFITLYPELDPDPYPLLCKRPTPHATRFPPLHGKQHCFMFHWKGKA